MDALENLSKEAGFREKRTYKYFTHTWITVGNKTALFPKALWMGKFRTGRHMLKAARVNNYSESNYNQFKRTRNQIDDGTV